MTVLNKIYKRTSTGKIQEWYMEVDGNKYRTISGQTDGKKVTSEWTTCEGKNVGKKNETTPAEQALAEAQAKRKKKLEKEYKETIDEVDNITFRSPMLAETYEGPLENFPYYVQPKLDGVRCVATKDGLFTRNGKAIVSCPHITNALKKVFEEDPDLELDGELYNHDLKDDFDALISLIKQLKPTEADLDASEKMVQYHLYDIRDSGSVFQKRSARLASIVKQVNSKKIVFVRTIEEGDQEALDNRYELFLEAGYEGMMIRLNTPYEYKRTDSLLKRKEMITDEFEIVDVLEGKGNRSGMAGKIIFKLHKPTTEGVETCEANPKGGFAFYKRLLKERETVIGKMATIEFQNYTPKGSLRFPKMLTVRDYE